MMAKERDVAILRPQSWRKYEARVVIGSLDARRGGGASLDCSRSSLSDAIATVVGLLRLISDDCEWH